MGSCLERRTKKRLLRLVCGSLSLGMLALMTGCGQNPRSVAHTEVSGQVLFQGKPLSGGRVNFITVQGAFASSGKIDEKGHYQLQAPVGDVQISVMNQKIPSQYQDPQTSGLKYTVKPGTQTHDIELSDNPSPTASAPGR
jgi:hypothetical protein